MVRLVVEAPLTDHQVRTRSLDLLDHLVEFGALVLLQAPEFFNASDVELVLGLGLGRLEGAGEDGEARVMYLVGHLWMGEVLVDDNTLYE